MRVLFRSQDAGRNGQRTARERGTLAEKLAGIRAGHSVARSRVRAGRGNRQRSGQSLRPARQLWDVAARSRAGSSDEGQQLGMAGSRFRDRQNAMQAKSVTGRVDSVGGGILKKKKRK